ncbi:hypothetical protein EYF80_057408 [Liparis tanakae]|uniref:Uncharacterized protein n=1 Tax=Liparis tanakae TaxID=230148 RepID=A0A4Z2EUV6_9TELE|nr:hypothetical protein EYF80_057408 [Liparis tanakae]
MDMATRGKQQEHFPLSIEYWSLRLQRFCQVCSVLELQTQTPLVMPTTSDMKIFSMNTATAGTEVRSEQAAPGSAPPGPAAPHGVCRPRCLQWSMLRRS